MFQDSRQHTMKSMTTLEFSERIFCDLSKREQESTGLQAAKSTKLVTLNPIPSEIALLKLAPIIPVSTDSISTGGAWSCKGSACSCCSCWPSGLQSGSKHIIFSRCHSVLMWYDLFQWLLCESGRPRPPGVLVESWAVNVFPKIYERVHFCCWNPRPSGTMPSYCLLF